jgi:hypothetical protein
MVTDYRDLAIEHLAADEVALLERIMDLEGECESYRELLRAALTALQDVTGERDDLRRRHHELLDDRRLQRGIVDRVNVSSTSEAAA